MEFIFSNKFQLIKKDLREIKNDLFNINNIDDWNKLIIFYNIYLFFSQIYIFCYIFDCFVYDNKHFINEFKKIYIFFFIICNIKNSYLHLIKNIYNINKKVGLSLYENTKEYIFI